MLLALGQAMLLTMRLSPILWREQFLMLCGGLGAHLEVGGYAEHHENIHPLIGVEQSPYQVT